MATSTQTNGHAENPSNAPAVGSAQTSKIQPNDVGWQFVPQYYNFVNKQPHRLHCFYNKRSTFIHGEEGEESQVALGQQQIHDQIVAIGYDECKVYIHSIDSQSSANGGIIILVIGEMSNKAQPWRKFTQTFFLAEQPNGYFVLNDIFRYLKEDVDEEEEAAAPAAEEQEPSPVAAPAVPEPQPAVEETKPAEQVTQEPAKAPEPEPEPATAPAEVVSDTVPEEAQVAAVPDKDVAPSEPAPAVEELTTAATPAVEETPAPAPAAAKSSPVPTAASPAPNGNASASAAPAPAPAAAPAPPAQPAAPPKPKTWASLAASGKPWSQAVSASQPATPAPAPAPAPKKEEAPAPAAAPASTSVDGKHPFFVNATRVNTPHCFVKLPNWTPDNQAGPVSETMSEPEVRAVAARFGEVKKVEIVRQKACAFIEFVRVDSARKAIIASLPVAQGGEDGVKFDGGKLNFETRKEKDERRPKGNAPGGGQRSGQASEGGRPRPSGQNQGQGQGQANGERGGQGSRGGRGPRGRGGQGNQGDRAPASAAAAK